MVARILGILMLAGAMSAPAFAGEVMKAHEARDFVAGKLFAFNCFDGTRGAGRIFSDGSAAGSIQFGGSGPTRFVRLPSNTLQGAARMSAPKSRACRSIRALQSRQDER